MEIYFNQNSSSLDQPGEEELKKAVPPHLIASLKSAVEESGVSFDEWARDPLAFLLVHGGNTLATWVRDLCGKRMIILGSDLPDEALLTSDLFVLAETVARKRGCHLMQWSLASERFVDRAWTLPPGFYVTNLIFEADALANQTPDLKPDPRFAALDFENPDFRKAAADIEYWVRWSYPGSTYAPLDTAALVRAEYEDYPALVKAGIAAGIGWADDPKRGYVLWIRSRPKDRALIAMIWVDPGARDELSGDELLREAVRRMAASGFGRVRYFVSAQNIPAMKMLHRSGFRLIQYNLNKALL